MHRTCPSENQWTTRDLLSVIERYVVRTRLSEYDKNELAEVKTLVDSLPFDSKKALSHITRLMDRANGKLDVYGPPDQFMYDLDTLMNFPNNYQFLAETDKLNYTTRPRYMQDTKGLEYISKNDVYLLIYRTFSSFCEEGDEVNRSLLMSLGNKISRQLKNCYEIVPTELVDNVCSTSTEVFSSLHHGKFRQHIQKRGFKLVNYTVDEVYRIFAQFFDEYHDVVILEQLRDYLEIYNKKKPISKHEEFYQALYLRMMIFNDAVGTICNRFPMIFQPYTKIKKTVKSHYPIVRFFKDAGAKLFLAKDLEYAITIALKTKFKNKALPGGLIPVENSDDKKRGILMTVDWKKFEHVLKTLGLTIDDLHIIEIVYQRTSRNIAAPIISQYGTHCKLATDAFYELFENITTGMRLFQGVSKENLPKVFEWFAKLNDVFSDTRKTRYCIEIWKIDEIIDRAYSELQKFVTQKIHELPKNQITFDKNRTLKEVLKFSPNFKLNPENVKAMHFYFTKTLGLESEITNRFVHQIYEHCVRLEFFKLNPKYTKFMHNQGACEGFRRLECECQSESENRSVENIPKSLEKLEILRDDYLVANRVYYDECFKNAVVTKDGKRFYDNETCFKLAIDRSIVNLCDFKARLAMFAYKAQSKRDEMIERRMFYMGEEEVQKVFEKTKNEFEDSIKYTNARSQAHNKSIHTREISWNEIWETLEDIFPQNNETDGIIEDVKRHLKTHDKATRRGLLGIYATELGEVCRQAQICYQKCHLYTRSLTEYREKSGEKTKIVIRIMSEMRVENQMDWHLFSEEALEAFKILLCEENRFAVMSKTLEQMEMKWYIQNKCSTITVAEFERAVECLRISKKNFVLVPDIQYCHQLTNLPFRMGYESASVIEPSAEIAYHYTQAQYLVFQQLACDIRWNLKSGERGSFREAIINEMKMLGDGGGYVPAETVDFSIINLMRNPHYQHAKRMNVETPLTSCHGKRYNDKISKSEFLNFVEQICDEKFAVTFKSAVFLKLMGFDANEDVKEIEVWKVRYVFMKFWIETFFEGESELKENVIKAWTVSLAHLNLPKMEDFKVWKSTMANFPNNYVIFDDFVFTMLTMQKNKEKDFEFTEEDFVTKHSWTVSLDNTSLTFDDYLVANSMKREPILKTEEVTPTKKKTMDLMFRRDFKEKEKSYVEIVEHPEDRDRIYMKIHEEQKNSKLNDKAVKRTLNNVLEHVNIVLPFISSEQFIEIDEFEELVCEHYKNAISIEDFKLLPLIIKEDLNKLKRKFEEVFEFKNINGKEYFRKIVCCTSESGVKEETDEEKENECEIIEQTKKYIKVQKQHMCEEKKEEPMKSTKVVEKCENCEETAILIKDVQVRFHGLEKKIAEREFTLTNASKVIDDYKKESDAEIKKLKLEVKNRDKRIHQIHQQKKKEAEDYASWKKEQAKKLDNVKEQLKSSNEQVHELEKNLEQSRLSENKNVQEKNRLINENRELALKNEQLAGLTESMQAMIQEKSAYIEILENRLGQIEQFHLFQARLQPVPVVLTPPPMAYPTPKRCPMVQQKMEEYEQILKIDVQGIVKMINGTSERFAERCTNPKELLSAKSEVSNFVKRFEAYIEAVDKQLKLCQQNIGIRIGDLAEIPKFPVPFSSLFMQTYERNLKKSGERKCWKKVEEEKAKELEDNECLICAGDMEEIKNVTKCTKCSRRYHSECISEWLKRNSTCPVCRASLLDPQEFPEL